MRTVRAAAALGVISLLGACAATSEQRAPGEATVHVERHTWGGLCATGPCASDLVVQDDGTWTYSSSETQDTSGTLSDTELDALYAAVADTALGGASAATQECAADADGTSVRYTWTLDDESGAASSCETAIDGKDPLVAYLDELATSVG
ncbi:hypothetical protein [Cellulomonas sp. URHE0023]|uniref:hypothetical protein n=1 Tax=Cellulomonas sp. URHE0023 TaxID=1380354 RepID=UPI00048077C6|nr:hypothetical protein [Cellulomonas sp. URHE0023]